MAALDPALKSFNVAVEKGWDHLPDKYFSTPGEKRKWQREERERQQEERRQQKEEERRQSDDTDPSFRPPPPPQGGNISSPPPGYVQDPYAQDRGFSRSGQQTFSPTSGRYDDFDPRDPNLTRKRNSRRSVDMQNDSSYQPPSRDDRRGYNPSDYQPRDGGYDDRVGYRRDNASSYGDGYSGRAASAGARGDRYSRYDDDEDDERDDRRDRKHRHHDSRSSSEEGIRGKIGGRFDKTEHGLATGALGALAGGVLGHEIGKGKGVWPTVAGVVIGGLGANALEARHEKKKHAREESGRRSRSVDGGKHAFRSSYDDDYDDYDDRRSSRRGGDRDYDDGRSGYDSRSGYDRYDRYER